MPNFENQSSTKKETNKQSYLTKLAIHSLEKDLIKNYPFLKERKEKLKQKVHYNETQLEHISNCLNEFKKLHPEFEVTFKKSTSKEKYQAIITKTLTLHEIGKLVTTGELKAMEIDPYSGNEKTGADIISAKYNQLNISNDKDAALISFLIKNYHTLNELHFGKKQINEVKLVISEGSQKLDMSPHDLVQLLRFVTNANNLSAVESNNLHNGTKFTREEVKQAIDQQAESLEHDL